MSHWMKQDLDLDPLVRADRNVDAVALDRQVPPAARRRD